MEKSYKNISYLFILILGVIFLGFFKTYFGLFPNFKGIPTLLHIHSFVILLWIVMLIVQPFLIRYKKYEWHRMVGKASYFLVPLLVFVVILVVRASQTKIMNLAIFAFAWSDMTFFVLTYTLAIFYRKKVSYHARFMIMTVLPFINPAIGRLPQSPLPGPAIGLLIIVSLLVYERFKAKIYKPYLFSLVGFLAIYLFFNLMITNPLWEQFWGLFFK
ncbi:hypothetical protein [Emticicia sp. SJ17W-69]|uniref:hypothetical protein n=1 Tax=Emticicia sp. SJ17W-69 TaxID=3421657 RepID=UPI003EBF7E97